MGGEIEIRRGWEGVFPYNNDRVAIKRGKWEALTWLSLIGFHLYGNIGDTCVNIFS